MRYIPNSPEERDEMLKIVGLNSADELFRSIPSNVQLNRALKITEPLAESEVIGAMESLALKNTATQKPSFLGAGVYSHFSPTVVDHLIQRSEFFTSYTPYQPEIAQGTLQYIFEFQTLIAQLTGMDVSNASMYDGSTSMAEAFLMAQRVTRRDKVVIAQTVHPEYLQVAKTYTQHGDLTIETVHFDQDSGRVLDDELSKLDDKTAAFVVQSPNFFGCIEDLTALAEKAHAVGALFIVVVTEAISFGLLKSPGACGADIVVGEGQSFGIPMSFGGPHLGLFATREKYVRQYAGQIVRRGLRQKRQSRFRADFIHARTAYSPRKSDFQHLHQSRVNRPRRHDLYGSDGQKRLAGSSDAERAESRLRQKENR